jgi:3-oxoacyl-(acyl-carrier-protein) synthase
MEHGIDSLGTVELQNALNLAFGTSVDATTIFNFPSVRALSEHIASTVPCVTVGGKLVGASSTLAQPPREILPEPTDLVPRPMIAVTGIVQKPIMLPSREPGTRTGRWQDCVVPTPSTRWDVDRFSDSANTDQVRFGVYLRDVFDFDGAMFRISVAEACSMDPQHRAILETAWPLQYRSPLSPRACVMTGIGTSDYIHHITNADPDGYFASGCAGSVSSGRLSYLFNLSGSSVAVDTACSSSSVALHLAFREVMSGACDGGIASGVNAILSPRKTLMFNLSGMLSSDGRCKTLDASASGYVRSESCTTVLIQRSEMAMSQYVIGYIAGTAVNQDGRSAGLTAPNGPAQERAIAGALVDASVIPDTYAVSMHGTGTELGDPIELGAVIKLFRNASVSLVATKGALGHAETGAGLVGLAGLLEQQGDRALPPMVHLRALNSHVVSLTSQSSASIVVPRAWAPGNLQRNDIGGTSAFAFQGTNAHVITHLASLPSYIDVPLVWKRRSQCVIPIFDRGLRLNDASRTTLQLSHHASRLGFPSIPHMACIYLAHQTVDLVFKDMTSAARDSPSRSRVR